MQAGGMQGGWHSGKMGVSVGGGIRSGRHVRTMWGWLTDGAWGPLECIDTGERGSWWWGGIVVVVGKAHH